MFFLCKFFLLFFYFKKCNEDKNEIKIDFIFELIKIDFVFELIEIDFVFEFKIYNKQTIIKSLLKNDNSMADIINNGQDVIIFKVYWTVWYSALEIVEVVAFDSAYQAYRWWEIIYQSIAFVIIANTSYTLGNTSYTLGK